MSNGHTMSSRSSYAFQVDCIQAMWTQSNRTRDNHHYLDSPNFCERASGFWEKPLRPSFQEPCKTITRFSSMSISRKQAFWIINTPMQSVFRSKQSEFFTRERDSFDCWRLNTELLTLWRARLNECLSESWIIHVGITFTITVAESKGALYNKHFTVFCTSKPCRNHATAQCSAHLHSQV